MRFKDKVYCCRCGKFLFKLNDEEMKIINKERAEGTMINSEYVCKGGCNKIKDLNRGCC